MDMLLLVMLFVAPLMVVVSWSLFMVVVLWPFISPRFPSIDIFHWEREHAVQLIIVRAHEETPLPILMQRRGCSVTEIGTIVRLCTGIELSQLDLVDQRFLKDWNALVVDSKCVLRLKIPLKPE